jgi:uncharacterized membrane protein
MSVKQVSMDLIRVRMPQAFRQGLMQLPRLPQWRPGAGLEAASKSLHWVSWRMVAAGVLLGGIIHICATFAGPILSAGHAYQQLAEKLPINQMVMLPLQAPGRQILPYLPPDALYSVCRYDLRSGPVAVTTAVLRPGWALSLHTPRGSNFYVLPGQSQRPTDVSFVVVGSGNDAGPLVRRESAADTQIASPSVEGLIVLRGPLRGLAWTAETEATLQRATCRPLRQ